MMNRKGVREAMDRRLSALCASPARRERIRQAAREEKTLKYKKTMVVLVAVALLLAMGTALAVEGNLFGLFAREDGRYAPLVQEAVTVTDSPVTLQDAFLGVVQAQIESIYYDGQTLSLAFILENAMEVREFIPTAEQMDHMSQQKGGWPVALPREMEEASQAVLKNYNAAVNAGTPAGYVLYSVFPSDHTMTEDGVDLPYGEEKATRAENAAYYLRTYAFPLPREAQNRDCLSIRMPLHATAQYTWFDGENTYTLSASLGDISPLTAEASRVERPANLTLRGEGEIRGAHCVAEVRVSLLSIAGVLTADQPLFHPDTNFVLTDPATGEILNCNFDAATTDNCSWRFTANGLGRWPDELALCPVLPDENGYLRDENIQWAQKILLRVQP